MGNCQAIQNRRSKILLIVEKYPKFHGGIQNQKSLLKQISDNENELWEHYQKFILYKPDIKKSNPTLYDYFFTNKYDEDENYENYGETIKEENDENKKYKMKIMDLKREDTERFYFFFNKADYVSLNIQNANTNFPLFHKEQFPNYRRSIYTSPLKELSLTCSDIILDDNASSWDLIKNLEKLDLSFNKIHKLPDHIEKLTQLKFISLRKNELVTLPLTFSKLINLEEIDLSENHFSVLNVDIFNKKLKMLNLIGNNFEKFNYNNNKGECRLERLFLAQNQMKEIPIQIGNFRQLKYVNLDENLITQFSKQYLEEKIKLKLIISLFKNKGINQELHLEKPEDSQERDKITKVYIPELIKRHLSNNSITKTFKDLAIQKELSHIQSQYKIKNPENDLERINNNKLKELTDKLIYNYNSKSMSEKEKFIREELYFFFVDEIENKINNGKENDIYTVEDNKFKERIKDYYLTYQKKKEFNDTGKIVDYNNDIEKEYFRQKIFKKKAEEDLQYISQLSLRTSNISAVQNFIIDKNKKDEIDKRDDVSNLIFLKTLNHYICSSKVTLYLQYLSKIDSNIKDLIVNLWITKDTNGFILMLTEFKLFVQELVLFYNKVDEKNNNPIVNYEVVRNQNKNVIHAIFYNDNSLKILYRIGLNEKRRIVYSGIEQDYFYFTINPSMHNKHKLFNDFLERFITILKSQKYDPMDLDL